MLQVQCSLPLLTSNLLKSLQHLHASLYMSLIHTHTMRKWSSEQFEIPKLNSLDACAQTRKCFRVRDSCLDVLHLQWCALFHYYAAFLCLTTFTPFTYTTRASVVRFSEPFRIALAGCVEVWVEVLRTATALHHSSHYTQAH